MRILSLRIKDVEALSSVTICCDKVCWKQSKSQFFLEYRSLIGEYRIFSHNFDFLPQKRPQGTKSQNHKIFFSKSLLLR